MNQPLQNQDMQLQYCPILKKNVLLSKEDRESECFTCHQFKECKSQYGQCCNEFIQSSEM
jgi:hypothetical protein